MQELVGLTLRCFQHRLLSRQNAVGKIRPNTALDQSTVTIESVSVTAPETVRGVWVAHFGWWCHTELRRLTHTHSSLSMHSIDSCHASSHRFALD